MKRILIIILLTLAAIAICFTSCGKKDNNTQNPADTTPEATEEKTLPPFAPEGKRPYVDVVNGYFRTFSKRDPAIRLASSEGLTDQGDALHFDAKSVRVLGHRFFEQYQILLKERYGVESIDPSKYVEK